MLEWNELYEALKEVFNEADLEDLINRKADLDEINYKGLYESKDFVSFNKRSLYLPAYDKDAGYVSLKPEITDPDCMVAQAFDAIKKEINEVNKSNKDTSPCQIGVISNGVHSIDLLMRYFSKDEISKIRKKDQSHKRVMLIYEAPASNLNATAAYRKITKAKNPAFSQSDREPSIEQYLGSGINGIKFSEELANCLTGTWWRVDEAEVKDDKKSIVNALHGMKKYSEFLQAFIRTFGLIDIYATNLFRFEIFREPKSGSSEKALNWNGISKLAGNKLYDIAFENILQKEIKGVLLL